MFSFVVFDKSELSGLHLHCFLDVAKHCKQFAENSVYNSKRHGTGTSGVQPPLIHQILILNLIQKIYKIKKVFKS